MHELSIAQSVVDIASRHAQGRKVTKVELRVGHLRQVVPAALSFSFELVAQGTPVEGAELVQDSVPALGRCSRCGGETLLESFPFQCGICAAFDLEIVAGDELVVESIEVEEAEVGKYSYSDIG